MKTRNIVLFLALAYVPASALRGSPCITQPLPNYLNSGNPFTCTELNGGVDVEFNQNSLVLSYAGLGVLASASASDITVVPGDISLDFDSSTFTVSGPTAAQGEVVQFSLTSTYPIDSTTFSLHNPSVSALTSNSAAVAVGQELVCVGGAFGSLPTGLVTTVTNGTLGTGEFGCNGTVLIGTAADQAGSLSLLSSTLSLPDLTGLTDTATIALGSNETTALGVIKIQALAQSSGSASTSGFGDTFTVMTPEPESMALSGAGALLILSAYLIQRYRRSSGRKQLSSQSPQ